MNAGAYGGAPVLAAGDRDDITALRHVDVTPVGYISAPAASNPLAIHRVWRHGFAIAGTKISADGHGYISARLRRYIG